jgi:hypothetical protein
MKVFILGSILVASLVASAPAFADDRKTYDASTDTCSTLQKALREDGELNLTNKSGGSEFFTLTPSTLVCNIGYSYRPAYTAASDKNSCHVGYTCVWEYPGF